MSIDFFCLVFTSQVLTSTRLFSFGGMMNKNWLAVLTVGMMSMSAHAVDGKISLQAFAERMRSFSEFSTSLSGKRIGSQSSCHFQMTKNQGNGLYVVSLSSSELARDVFESITVPSTSTIYFKSSGDSASERISYYVGRQARIGESAILTFTTYEDISDFSVSIKRNDKKEAISCYFSE